MHAGPIQGPTYHSLLQADSHQNHQLVLRSGSRPRLNNQFALQDPHHVS